MTRRPQPAKPAEGASADGDESNARAPRRIASSELFGAARELVIEHGGRTYQLRITQNGKLILTA